MTSPVFLLVFLCLFSAVCWLVLINGYELLGALEDNVRASQDKSSHLVYCKS